MHFVVIGKDKGDGTLRTKERAAHLNHVASFQHLIVYGGPLIEDSRMVGSVIVFDVPDREALDEYLSSDPYFTRPIFETVEIYESRWMVPEREPGALATEAKRARGG